jgi:ABC-2 type transport system permease protein
VDRTLALGGTFGTRLRSAWTELREGAVLFRRLVGAQVRSQLQYRASFALQVVGQFAATCVDFISTAILMLRFREIDGWDLGDVALLYGISGVAFALADLVIGGFDNLSPAILTGQFDRVMTRPVGTFMQTLAADFQLRRLGRAAQAAIVLVGALVLADVSWSVAKVAVLVGAIASGVVIFGSVFVIGAAVTFWTVQTSEVTNVFTYGGQEMTSYPMTIYGRWLRRFFSFIVPLAFVSYLPALFILDRPNPLGMPRIVELSSPLVALLFFFVARGAWALGVKHYQSTGS